MENSDGCSLIATIIVTIIAAIVIMIITSLAFMAGSSQAWQLNLKYIALNAAGHGLASNTNGQKAHQGLPDLGCFAVVKISPPATYTIEQV